MDTMQLIATILASVGIALAIVSLLRNNGKDHYNEYKHHDNSQNPDDSRYIEITTKKHTEREFWDTIDKCFKKESEIR